MRSKLDNSPSKCVQIEIHNKKQNIVMLYNLQVTEEIPDFPCKQMDDGDEIGDNLDTSDKEGFTDDEDKNNYTITDDESEVEFEDGNHCNHCNVHHSLLSQSIKLYLQVLFHVHL